MRIAALDLGSNSFHLLVAEARLDGSFAPLIAEKEMLRLGDRVAQTGKIGAAALREAVAVVGRFRQIAESLHADEIVAVGTAALREAEDGVAFVEAVREDVGIDVQIVDGVAEARLIFTAIRSSVLIDRPPALAADLGGGSLELMVGDQSGIEYAASVHLGVGRLTAELDMEDPPSDADRARLAKRIETELAGVLPEVRDLGPNMLVGSSGTFLCLARMAASAAGADVGETMNQLTVTRRDLDVVCSRIFALPVELRSRLDGCDQKRAELLPAGAAVLSHLMDETGLGELTVSEWALREGIVLQAIGAHDRADLGDDPRLIRRASVLSLCRRSNWRQPHARQVASLATQLFDHTADLHGLGEIDRELLEFAALLHDIGEHVSRTDHDRHSAYLIENGELRGFSPDEVRLLAAVGRFHIRGNPRAQSSEAYAALDDEDRRRAVQLVALLRIADGLDATHTGVVRALGVRRLDERRREVAIEARGDAELEQWTFRRKRELFEKTFGVELEISEIPLGRDDYEEPDMAVAGLS